MKGNFFVVMNLFFNASFRGIRRIFLLFVLMLTEKDLEKRAKRAMEMRKGKEET
jgi:hypothetical protein